MGNPYERRQFAESYVAAQTDRKRNRYEWEVTWPALRQFIRPGMRVIDYGCGGGVFTAEMAKIVGSNGSCVGTDASPEMIRHTGAYANQANLSFMQWDACQTDSSLQDGTADLVVAKLSLNYVSQEDLYKRVLRRLRACLKDTGLAVIILPNPYKEADYDLTTYTNMEQVPIQVGDFGDQLTATAYHHIVEMVLDASYFGAGFAFASALSLPRSHLDPIPQASSDPEALKLSQRDGVPDQLLESKRLMYVLGAGIRSGTTYLDAIDRHNDWLRQTFSDH